MTRPPALITPASRSSRVISSGAVRLTAMTLPQRSSAMLASFLSRVMPALCTTTSTPPWCSRRWWAMRCGASLAVMSRTRWSPSSSAMRVWSSLAAWGTSTPTTVAPSRCSTRAISSPMPRLAPVTRATLPARGRVQSSTWSVAVEPWAPMRTTWPETYADLGERRKASVELIAPSAAGATYTSWTAPPRPISLPSERVKPSSARCATRSEPDVSSGGVPMTTTRGQVSSRRMRGVKNSCSAMSPAVSTMPVASNTSALARVSSASEVVEAMPSPSRVVGSTSVRRPVPPRTTTPSTSGAPSVQRSSSVGLGRPRFLTNSWPIEVDTKPW